MSNATNGDDPSEVGLMHVVICGPTSMTLGVPTTNCQSSSTRVTPCGTLVSEVVVDGEFRISETDAAHPRKRLMIVSIRPVHQRGWIEPGFRSVPWPEWAWT